METRKIKTTARGIQGKMNPLPKGRILEGRYRIDRKLGSGGVGFVYRAEHLRLNRAVAVKVLQPQYTASPKLKARFERESQALAMMAHPNIVTISDYGVTEKMPFLVMELLQGEPLSERLKSGPLETKAAFEIGRQILQALTFAHEHGWVHRDLKPGNVFLQDLAGGSIHIKILDFGLAKLVASDGRAKGPQLTLTGMVFGTPAYMAPEQAVGGETDARTDLYSTGVVLFEMLAGRRLFVGEADHLMRQHLQAPPPALNEACPHRKGVPELEALLRKTLSKEKGDRFQTAMEMIEALDQLPDPAVLEGEDAERLRVESGSDPAHGLASSEVSRPSEAPTVEATPTPKPVAIEDPLEPLELSSPFTLQPFPWKTVAVIAGLAGSVVIVVIVIFSLSTTATNDGGGSSTPITASDGGRAGDGASLEASSPATTSPPVVASPEVDSEPTSPVVESHETDVDRGPLASDDLPPMLESAHHTLNSGRELPQSLYNRIRNYAISHRDDPRAFLILGRHNARRGHLTDAISNYQRAYDADHEARQDPQMLRDLVRLVASNAVGYRAARAIERIYGSEALPAVERTLASNDLEGPARQRLERLRDSIGSPR